MIQAAPDAVEEFKQKTGAKLRDLRCPQHHKPPVVSFRGTTLRDVTVRMSACCDELIELANKAIAGQAK